MNVLELLRVPFNSLSAFTFPRIAVLALDVSINQILDDTCSFSTSIVISVSSEIDFEDPSTNKIGVQ